MNSRSQLQSTEGRHSFRQLDSQILEEELLRPSRKSTEQVKKHLDIDDGMERYGRASRNLTNKYRGQFPTIMEEIKHDSENNAVSIPSSARNCEVSSEEVEDTPLTRLMESGLDISGTFPKPSYSGSPYRVQQSSLGSGTQLQQIQVYSSLKDFKLDTQALNIHDERKSTVPLSEHLGTVSMGSKSISIDPGDESEEQKSHEFILNIKEDFEQEEEEFEHQVPAPIQALAVTDMCQLSSNEIVKLKLKLSQQMRFMNMVVHDMRNPTVSTKLGLESTLEQLEEAEDNLNNLIKIASTSNLPSSAQLEASSRPQPEAKDGELKSPEEFTLGQINSVREQCSARSHTSERIDSERKHDVNKASASILGRINKIQEEFTSGQDTIHDILDSWQALSPSPIKEAVSPEPDEEEDNEIADEDPTSGWGYFKECKTSRIIKDKVDTVMGLFSTILKSSQVDIDQPSLQVAKELFEQTVKDCFNHEGLAFDPVPYLRIFDAHNCQGECGGRGRVDTSKSLVLSLQNLEQQPPFPVGKKEIYNLQRKFSVFCQVYQDELDSLSHDVQGLVAQSKIPQVEAGLLGKTQKLLSDIKQGVEDQRGPIETSKSLVQNQILTQTMIENLVDDLLDLAKMQNDSFRFCSEYFDLSGTVLKAFEILLHSAHERGVEMKAQVEKKSDLKFLTSVFGDSRRFIQIILNFMSNSIKFTPAGGSVRVLFKILDCQLMPKDEEAKRLSDDHSEKTASSPTQYYVSMAISIIDSGTGISEEGKKNLFVDFNKLDENANLNAKGTGLGLSICKMIIEKFGGTVDIESEVDSGCEFIIKLNLKCQVWDMQSPRFQQEQDSQEIDGSLEHPSFISYQSTENEFYDFLHKPQASCNIISQIKKRPTPPKKVENMNTLSFGIANPEDQQDQEELPVLGMNLHVDHPRIVSKSVHIRKSAGPDCDTDSVAQAAADIQDSLPSSRNQLQYQNNVVFSFDPSRKMKCLVANDEQIQLRVLTTMFENNGFEVTTAMNGHEAFIKIQESFENAELAKMYDLIILDLNMPISDGYDACQKIGRLYSQKQQIDFNEPTSKTSSNSIIAHSTIQSNQATKSENQNHIRLEDTDLMPLMIALTSHVDDRVRERTEDAGFMMTMMTPLRVQQIQLEVLPILKERLWKITRKVRLIEFYENNVSLRQYLRKESQADLSFASNAIRQSTKSLSQLLSNDHQIFGLSSKKLFTGQKHLNKMLMSSENLFFTQFDKPLARRQDIPHRLMSDSLGNIMSPLPLKKVSSHQHQQHQKRFSGIFSTGNGADLDSSSSVSNSFREASRGGTRQPVQKSKFAQIEVSKHSTLTDGEQSNGSYSSEEDNSEEERPVGTVESK